MRLGHLILVLGLLIVVLTSGCMESKKIEKCEQKTNSTERDDCYSGQAFITHESDYCEQIRNQDIKDNCYFTIAVSSNRRSLCNKISDEEIRLQCLAGTR